MKATHTTTITLWVGGKAVPEGTEVQHLTPLTDKDRIALVRFPTGHVIEVGEENLVPIPAECKPCRDCFDLEEFNEVELATHLLKDMDGKTVMALCTDHASLAHGTFGRAVHTLEELK